MGINSYKKKIEKILIKKGFNDSKILDFIVNNVNKKDLDNLVPEIEKLNSMGRIISKINSYSSTDNILQLNSGYRVKKFRSRTKKVSLQLLIDKSLKSEFDQLKKKYNLTSEKLLERLINNSE